MTSFLMEAVVLCALFHLGVWVQVRQAPARRVYSYAPAFVERYIELGKIPEIKNPSTLERVKKKWPAAIVIGILLGAIYPATNNTRMIQPSARFGDMDRPSSLGLSFSCTSSGKFFASRAVGSVTVTPQMPRNSRTQPVRDSITVIFRRASLFFQMLREWSPL